MVQLHHKVKTFEHLNKHFVLIAQDALIDYIKENFDLSAFHAARLGDSMQFHSYKYQIDDNDKKTTLQLSSRISTDSIGLGQALGLNANAEVELQDMINVLMSKISDETLFRPMSLIPGHRPIVHYWTHCIRSRLIGVVDGLNFKYLDDTIALHQRKLDLLKEQKKGYLQNMFV